MDHDEVSEIYSSYDTDGDGLSMKELSRALRAAGVFLPRSAIRQAMREYDESGDGRLDLEEFTNLVNKLHEEAAEDDDDEDEHDTAETARAAGALPPHEKCPSGHPFMIRASNPSGYGPNPACCNECNQSVDFASRFRHCPKCQYDVCHRCRGMPQPPKCNHGHIMNELFVDPPDYGGKTANCDKCHGHVDARKGMAHCKTCSYDLCYVCKILPAAAPPPPPAKPPAPPASAAATGAAGASSAPRKGTKALFIGINYAGSPHALRGCANDVRTMQHLLKFLKVQVADAHTLSDDAKLQGVTAPPTRANILDGIDWLARGAVAGDSLLLHYSGHGTQVYSATSQEEDKKEEAICPADLDTAGVITDDDLLQRLVLRLPGGVRLTVVMDCCHSGSMLDLPYTFVGSKAEVDRARQGGVAGTRAGQHSVVAASVFMISGCADEQTSADVSTTAGFKLNADVADVKGAGGACTNALAESLCENPSMALVDLLGEMRKHLKERGFSQIPQLSSSKQVTASDVFRVSGGA